MVKSLDGLISFLLDEIALCGEEGKSSFLRFSLLHTSTSIHVGVLFSFSQSLLGLLQFQAQR